MKKSLILLITLGIALSTLAADAPTSPKRFGKVISLTGKATVQKPDGAKADLKVGDELLAGSVLKTDKDTVIQFFFRRIGTIIEAEPNTTVTLDKLEASYKDGKLVKRTELSLQEGKIYTCVRVLIPDSKVIVRTPKATFQVPGTGMGRFEFNGDGSALVGRKSRLTLVATVGRESVAVSPGQLFDPKQTNAIAVAPPRLEAFVKKMDILQNTAQSLTPPPAPEDLPN